MSVIMPGAAASKNSKKKAENKSAALLRCPAVSADGGFCELVRSTDAAFCEFWRGDAEAFEVSRFCEPRCFEMPSSTHGGLGRGHSQDIP